MNKPKLETRVIELDPNEVKLLDINPHFMTREKMAQLTENIKEDGELTQIPFAVLEKDGRYRVISGNHRIMAARLANLKSVKVQVTDQELPKDRKIGLQLSHNALRGEDDLAQLKLVYESIEDVDYKQYSGLDDKVLELLEEVKPASLSEAQLEFVPVVLLFLPEEVERIKELIEAAGKAIKGDEVWVASMKQFERFVDALSQAGGAHNVKNMATQLEVVLRLFEGHLTELQEGMFDGEEPKHNSAVPLAAMMGVNYVPMSLARLMQMAIKKEQKADPEMTPLDILEKWAKGAYDAK